MSRQDIIISLLTEASCVLRDVAEDNARAIQSLQSPTQKEPMSDSTRNWLIDKKLRQTVIIEELLEAVNKHIYSNDKVLEWLDKHPKILDHIHKSLAIEEKDAVR